MARLGNFRDSTRYKSFVRQGRGIVKDLSNAQFALGDLVLRFEDSTAATDAATLAKQERALADDIDVSFETLRRYRDVAVAWPQEHRRYAIGFHIHDSLKQHKYRFSIIDNPPLDPLTNTRRWTADQVARATGKMPHQPVTREEKIQRIHALAQDEVIMAEVATDFLERPEVAHRSSRIATHGTLSTALGSIRPRMPKPQ